MIDLRNLLIAIIALLFFTGCKKSGNTSANSQPANLVINATVSTDSTGLVIFKASADNTVSYFFEFGNGDNKTVANGSVSYQYTTTGTITYTASVTATGSTGLTLKKSITVTVTRKYFPPTLLWSDEFNTDGAPDSSKWGYDLGNGNGWGNSELEYYTNRPENAVVQNGNLKITAIRENYGGSAFTSGRLITKDKFAFTYGKIEIRAKLPSGVGTWPAIWMLGSDFATNTWPACGEMDIMEQRGSELCKLSDKSGQKIG